MLAAGTLVGGYRIEGTLGRGGMGAVYEATQLSLGRVVALKLLDPALGADESFRGRFRREGRLQGAIEHPHIVTVHEAGEAPEGLFIAMRLIRGPNLKQLIRASELTPGRSLQLLGQVAGALDSAHAAGLMHRDIKPQNILVGSGDHAYLADFGLTKAAEGSGYTKTGEFLGTLDYVAPEQIRGEATPASDVYALAAVAYECLTGSVLFPREHEAALLFAHITEDPVAPSKRAPRLPAAVDEAIARGLAKDPDLRAATATDLVAGLVAALAQGGVPRAAPARTTVRAAAPGTEAAVRSATTRKRHRVAASRAASAVTPTTVAVGAVARSRLSRSRLVFAGAAVVGAGAGVGLLAGAALSGGTSSGLDGRRVQAGQLSMSVPAGWRQRTAALDGPELQDAASVGPPAPTSASVALGHSQGDGRFLLPRGFLRNLKDGTPDGERVRLGRLEAIRYRDLELDGGARVTVYVAPEREKVATLTCVDVEAVDCDRMAATLELSDALEPVPLGPRDGYARELGAVLAPLAEARARALAALGRAGSAPRQAAAATTLATAHATAAAALGELPPTPLERTAQIALVAALDDGSAAYGRLAAAARGRNRERFAGARAGVAKAERAVHSALARYGPLGYAVG